MTELLMIESLILELLWLVVFLVLLLLWALLEWWFSSMELLWSYFDPSRKIVNNILISLNLNDARTVFNWFKMLPVCLPVK